MIKIHYCSTDWCGPCKMFKPIVEKFFAAHPEIETEFLDASKPIPFNVTSVPTIIFSKDGQEVSRLVGLQSTNKLEQMLEDVTF